MSRFSWSESVEGIWAGVSRLLPAMLLSVSFVSAPLWAQDEVRINVGIAAAKPGDPIDIPLTFSAGESAQAGTVVAHISYPKDLLEYTEAERGLAVELADGEVKVSTAADPSDPAQTQIEFTATGKSCIKPGILGYLKFKVSNQAQKGTVDLKLKDSKAAGCQGGGDIQLAKGDDGQLTIFAIDEEIPVIGCFFFTH